MLMPHNPGLINENENSAELQIDITRLRFFFPDTKPRKQNRSDKQAKNVTPAIQRGPNAQLIVYTHVKSFSCVQSSAGLILPGTILNEYTTLR